MSNTENSTLSSYNSLLDKNLTGYFSNTKMRKHLVKSGMINRDGRITSENAYRMKMARKEHRDNVRDLLASAIVDKALDMERMRRYEIRKRLEELYKIELVQKVRSDRGKRVNDDLVALLTPRKSGKQRKTKSAAVTKTEKNTTKLPTIHPVNRTQNMYFEVAESTNSNNSGSIPERSHSHAPPPSEKKKLHPHPPPGRSKKKKRNVHRGLMLAKSDQMIAHRIQLQSMAEVTMKYLGSPLNLTNDMFPSNKVSEIQIIQQHCGASTICVFKELLPANTLFTFVSRRHRGSPFGLTIYINGIQNIRISSCCEYKHRPGHKVGGKNSQFGLVAVQGAAPCYKCQVRLNLVGGNKTGEKENEASSSDEESAVKSYDIIVSRLGRHTDSKLERPVSASVMTQTVEDAAAAEKVVEEHIDETNNYQDEEFEEDAQFSLKQEELSSDSEGASSSESSDSESEDEQKDKEEEDDANSVGKNSDSEEEEEAENNSDKKEDNNTVNVKDYLGTDSEFESDSSSSDESEKSIDVEIPSDPKKSEVKEASEVEESSEVEEVEEANEAIDGSSDQEILNHITIEKEASSDDESTLSASSSSSDSDSDNEKVDAKDDVKNSSDSAASIKSDDEEENEKSKAVDVVLSDEPTKAEQTSEQDNDSSTEVEESSDSENDHKNLEETEGKEEEEEQEEIKEEEEEEEGDVSEKNEDDKIDDQLVLPDVEGEKDLGSDSDESDNRATSVISRESTMLTGNEDGNFDSANITIQFNEEVDVVTYAKGEGTSTEEETPRSDESETEFETTNITGGSVLLADLDNAGDDDNEDEDIDGLLNEAENIEAKSDLDDDEDVDNLLASANDILQILPSSSSYIKESEFEKRSFKEGSIESFVPDWANVALENIYLTEDQTYELISCIEEHKDDIINFSLRNTIVDGGIEVIKDSLKQALNMESLDLSCTHLGPEEVEHLVEIILDGTKDIQTLILRGNPIDDEGTAILTPALTKLKYFKSLDLSDCKVSDDACEALFDYLSENTTLTELILSSNEINSEGWRYLASALKENTTLEVLTVDSNNMGDEGIQLLCNGIIKNKSLHTLDVRNNGLGDEGSDALYEAIVKCSTLLNVKIMPNNLFSDEKQDNLYKLIKMKN